MRAIPVNLSQRLSAACNVRVVVLIILPSPAALAFDAALQEKGSFTESIRCDPCHSPKLCKAINLIP
jgi:hypothetical protein